jgi:sodium/potassium-transporting ATPase subunit alpha
MYTYFLVLNDFGIRPQALWGLALLESPMPKPTDVYDPLDFSAGGGSKATVVNDSNGDPLYSSLYGNTNMLEPEADWGSLRWDATRNGKVDVRMFYGEQREPSDWVACRFDPGDKDLPKFYRVSVISDSPICYSTEALKFAQSGYLVSIVCVQWADLMICKTRNLSLAQQGMANSFANFGLFSETALVAVLLYVPFLNVALGTRQIPFPHFAVPSMTFFVSIFFYDELRKIYLRRGMTREGGKLQLKGWIVQNTYY